MSTRGIMVRLFLTCWLVYGIHFATDVAREHYLVLSIAEQGSFRLDPYYGLHPDIFQLPNGHAYHGANPGISMIAAVPYFMLRPAVDLVVRRQLARRAASSDTTKVSFRDPRPARAQFYQQARERGLDIKFGLVGLISALLVMAPLAAWSAVLLFRVLLGTGFSRTVALGGAILYAFGTPVFFRAAYLNQNLAVGVFGFAAFALAWNPGQAFGLRERSRHFWSGFLAGLALLCDYSGGVLLALIGLYLLVCHLRGPRARLITGIGWYAAGALGPILALWYYQWAAFGNPFYPPQHHMPPVEWSDLGYQGVTGPQADLVWVLLLDPRFGLFITTPILAFSLFAPWLSATKRSPIPFREALLLIAIPAAFVTFFSAVQYTQLQYITGIRYLIPVIPFLMVLTIAVLVHFPRPVAWILGGLSLGLGWAMAMVRVPYPDRSVIGVLRTVASEGIQLPALTTVARLSEAYRESPAHVVLPIAVLALAALVLMIIWRPGRRSAGGGA